MPSIWDGLEEVSHPYSKDCSCDFCVALTKRLDEVEPYLKALRGSTIFSREDMAVRINARADGQ